jgi:hypothetical protein
MNENAAVYLESNLDCSDYFSLHNISYWYASIGLIKSPLETWHHLAVVYLNTTVFIYVNGTLSSQNKKMFPSSTMNTVREFNFFGMGRNSTGGELISNIVIDEIKIFNKALTLEQVKIDMEASDGIASGIC